MSVRLALSPSPKRADSALSCRGSACGRGRESTDCESASRVNPCVRTSGRARCSNWCLSLGEYVWFIFRCRLSLPQRCCCHSSITLVVVEGIEQPDETDASKYEVGSDRTQLHSNRTRHRHNPLLGLCRHSSLSILPLIDCSPWPLRLPVFFACILILQLYQCQTGVSDFATYLQSRNADSYVQKIPVATLPLLHLHRRSRNPYR